MGGRYSRGLSGRIGGDGFRRAAAGAPARADFARRALVLAWLPVALWVGVIAVLSQGGFSADWSHGRFIAPLIRLLGLSGNIAESGNFWLRKVAHFATYATLGWLTLRALLLSVPRARGALLGLAFALAVGSADEWNQAHEATRTGASRDVALDLAGAACGVALRSRFARTPRRARDGFNPGAAAGSG